MEQKTFIIPNILLEEEIKESTLKTPYNFDVCFSNCLVNMGLQLIFSHSEIRYDKTIEMLINKLLYNNESIYNFIMECVYKSFSTPCFINLVYYKSLGIVITFNFIRSNYD